MVVSAQDKQTDKKVEQKVRTNVLVQRDGQFVFDSQGAPPPGTRFAQMRRSQLASLPALPATP